MAGGRLVQNGDEPTTRPNLGAVYLPCSRGGASEMPQVRKVNAESDQSLQYHLGMNQVNYGNLLDIQTRLQYELDQGERRLVTVFGSGLTNSVMPDVAKITNIFRDFVPAGGLDRFDKTVSPHMGTPYGYQSAASILGYQAGEKVVMRAIRYAVLTAYKGNNVQDLKLVAANEELCKELETSDDWEIPLGYKKFANLFAQLDGKLRGPIITTNFDPLIEIALRGAHLRNQPIPIPVDMAPDPEAIESYSDQPVLHLHGFWTGRAASNTPARITTARPGVDKLLRSILRNSLVLVVGYSGWEDGFMRSLKSRITDEYDLLNCDVLWCCYDDAPPKPTEGESIGEFVSTPGVTLYTGVDGHKIFDFGLREYNVANRHGVVPRGYTQILEITADEDVNPEGFVGGRHPTWADAAPGAWPMLEASKKVKNVVEKAMSDGGGRGVISVGPLGEGKSLSIRQVAVAVATEKPDWAVIWREAGAPPHNRILA